MYSIKEVAKELHTKPHVIRHRMKKLGLGKKVGGWNIVLTDNDVERLRGEMNVRQEAA